MKKRILSALLAIVMLMSALPFSALAYGTESYGENGNTVKYGDVNGDGEVNSIDVDLLARYLAMDTSATIDLTAADVDVNGTVDMNDLLNLVKYVKGDTSVSLGNTVTITFDTNGGTDIDPITVVAGSTITAPEAQKDNAVFLGWYTDEACKTPVNSAWVDAETNRLIPQKTGAIWTAQTYYAKFVALKTDLTITTKSTANIDANQTFIFNIKGKEGTDTEGIDLTVTVIGNGSTTVTELPTGQYTVTELIGWSWRYENDAYQKEIALEYSDVDNELIFDNSRHNGKWLDGNAVKDNRF